MRKQQQRSKAQQNLANEAYKEHGDWYEVRLVMQKKGHEATSAVWCYQASLAERRAKGLPKRRRHWMKAADAAELARRVEALSDEDGDLTESELLGLVYEVSASATTLKNVYAVIVKGEENLVKGRKLPAWGKKGRQLYLAGKHAEPEAAYPVTNKEKRAAVQAALDESPGAPQGNRQLARDLGVSEALVRRMRREEEDALLDKIRVAVRSELVAFAEQYDVCVEKKNAFGEKE